MTRMLIVGDVHLQKDRRHRGEKLLEELAILIEKENIKYVMFLGDMFHYHDKAFAQCFKMYDTFYSRVKEKVDWIFHLTGNHEMSNSVEFLAEEHVLLPYKYTNKIKVIDKPETIQLGNCVFTAMPFVPPGLFHIALTSLAKVSNLIFAHQEFSGANYGNGLIGRSTDLVPDGCYVISGHIHRQSKQDQLWYVGTPMHSDFGDEGDKFVHIIDIVGQSFTVEKTIELNVPKYITHHVNCLELLEKGFTEELSESDDHRIVVKGTKPLCLTVRSSDVYSSLSKEAKVVFDVEEDEKLLIEKKDVSSYNDLLKEYAEAKDLGDVYASVFN